MPPNHLYRVEQDLARARAELEAMLGDDGRFLLDYIGSLEALLARHKATGRRVPTPPRPVVTVSQNGSKVPKGATRDRLLLLLADGRSHRVGDLAAAMGKTVTATSAALRSMRDLDLVKFEGRKKGYRLSPEGPHQAPAMPLPETLSRSEDVGGPEAAAPVAGAAVSPYS